jgi:4-hydroxy-tetrahydrodipicolinate synthase
MDGKSRGFFAIAMTPFAETGELLWDELEAEFDWIVRAGAHGVVWPVNDSEQQVLSHPERVRGIELLVKTVDRRIPVVAGVADNSKAAAVAYAEAAAKAGADAVIALPPWARKMSSEDLIEDYYRAVADAAAVPVVLQNLLPPIGSAMPSSLMVELSKRIPLVSYVKEERDPHGQNVSELIELAGPEIKGVFTGGQVLGLIDAHKRGASGNMASSEISDIQAQIWDLMEAGKESEARELQDREAIFLKCMRTSPGQGLRKHVLVRRGVFSCDAVRNAGRPLLDAVFLAELDHAMSLLEPHFRV